MKRAKILLLTLMGLMLVFAVSCSNDDDDTDASGLNLEGEYQLTKMDFLSDNAVWNPELEANSENAFGYAPYMFEFAGIKGMIFGNQNVTDASGDVLGKRFDYILGQDFGQGDMAYWYWNYVDNGEAFEAIQLDQPLPPHNYSIYDMTNVEKLEGGDKIVFKAYIKSRKVGGEIGDNLDTQVEFTIVKGIATEKVDIYIQGEPYNPQS